MWSTVTDLYKYERTLSEGKIISAEMLAESRTVYRPDQWSGDDKPALGWGWFIDMPTKGFPYKVVQHTGSQGGFRAFHVSIPEANLTYVCLCNIPVPIRMFMQKGIEIIARHGLLE